MFDIVRDRRKQLKKEEKTKNEEKSNIENKYFFTFNFLYRKIDILLEEILAKMFSHLFYYFFTRQVIGNVVIKYQRPYRI